MIHPKIGKALGPQQQLELHIQRPKEKDRNFLKGGRSFYFFDFDDNIAMLGTPTYVFHKETGKELELTSGQFVEQSPFIGKVGVLKDYEIRFDDEKGSFRNFRDKNFSLLHKLLGRQQTFVEDLLVALGLPDLHWKGPSWPCFFHAVYNRRPVAVITARGHHPRTLKRGIQEFVRKGHLPNEPNYLALYPVSHPQVRENLGLCATDSIAKLKQAAICAAVDRAFAEYGYNPHHRFGMSDDDPKNIHLIIEEMSRLKKIYSENSFYVIETHGGKFVKREIFADHTESAEFPSEQLNLFHVDSTP